MEDVLFLIVAWTAQVVYFVYFFHVWAVNAIVTTLGALYLMWRVQGKFWTPVKLADYIQVVCLLLPFTTFILVTCTILPILVICVYNYA